MMEIDNKRLIEERSEKIFETLNMCINLNGLIDAVKLAKAFGFEIIEHNGLQPLINGIITSSCNSNEIVINDNLSKEQKRYTIIYLISNYLLYYQNQKIFNIRHIYLKEDVDAAYMARLLLIPEKILKISNSKNNENIQYLANIFCVPGIVMSERIADLNKTKHKILVKE